jgi:hypothetical protein
MMRRQSGTSRFSTRHYMIRHLEMSFPLVLLFSNSSSTHKERLLHEQEAPSETSHLVGDDFLAFSCPRACVTCCIYAPPNVQQLFFPSPQPSSIVSSHSVRYHQSNAHHHYAFTQVHRYRFRGAWIIRSATCTNRQIQYPIIAICYHRYCSCSEHPYTEAGMWCPDAYMDQDHVI